MHRGLGWSGSLSLPKSFPPVMYLLRNPLFCSGDLPSMLIVTTPKQLFNINGEKKEILIERLHSRENRLMHSSSYLIAGQKWLLFSF